MFVGALVAIVWIGSFQVPPGARHGERAVRVADVRATARIVFEGFVLEADGSPAAEAVVVSSAGGETVTGLDGRYRLEVEVPSAARRVELTAVGSDGNQRVGRTSVELLQSSPVVPVDPLALQTRPAGRTCWQPTFGGLPGTESPVLALTTFDDGNGAALYAGGSFVTAGGGAANRVARWDGSRWSRVGSGVSGGSAASVRALAVFDDGNGAALYAAGTFTTAGGSVANRIARWNGSSWSALGSGMDAEVDALTVFDDGGGPALYAAGQFTTAGGSAAKHIARWNGASWSALGLGTNADVAALTVFDDGAGPALYAGGQFTTAGGSAAKRIARWNGSSWSALGNGTNSEVTALAVFDDGGGPALYAGGQFTSAGGSAAQRVAKWNGSSWAPLGSGTDAPIAALAVFDDGSGPALFAGGVHSFAGALSVRHISKWDGSSWSALGFGTDGVVQALTVFDDGSGPALYAGGSFQSSSASVSVETERVARWDGAEWSALGGARAPSGPVQALATFDDGTGPTLYAGGTFDFAGGAGVSRIAKWNGSSWSPLEFGFFLSGTTAEVRALTVFDDGGGPALYVGGTFGAAGTVLARNIAKWDGTSWSALGNGIDHGITVNSLVVFDDGGGPALYAGGNFTSAGGVTANHVAKWNGSSWSALGSGVNGTGVNALAVFDDGSGRALYAGGAFTLAGGFPANRVARWNGSSWSEVSGGTNAPVTSLAVFDDGSGPALYAGGSFTIAGVIDAKHVARWNGSAWTALGSGTNDSVDVMATFDDGDGPALFAGGTFTLAGGTAANRIARWDASGWKPLGRGTSGGVAAMAVFGTGRNAALFTGGSFGSAYDSGDSYLARWVCTGIFAKADFRAR